MLTVSNIACILLLLSSICNYLYCIKIDGIDYQEKGHTLERDVELHSRSALISLDTRFALAMHPNGNLILYFISTMYNNYGEILWQTNTNQGDQNYDRFLIYQSDGNLVLYTKQSDNTQRALWATDKQHDNIGYVVLQNDGNLVVRGHDTEFHWGLLNSYGVIIPASTYSKAGPPPGYRYNNLITYIKGQEYCLSAGVINHYPATHDLNPGEHNLYWCDNSNNNNNCRCLGLYHDSSKHLSYIINGITYIVERDFDQRKGNQVDFKQRNLKADPDGNPDDFAWDDKQLCHTWKGGPFGLDTYTCCIAWDGDIQTYIDVIDGNSKTGTEAKCNTSGDDDVEWKFKSS